MNVSELLVSTRKQAGLTQADLAIRSGTSQATLSRYEAGDAVPTIATLERLLAAAGATLTLGAKPSGRMLNARSPRMTKLRQHRAEILAILKKHHASNPRVFGSVARGDDGPASDIDLLIEIDMHNRNLFDLYTVELELEDLLAEKVDINPVSTLRAEIREHAVQESVPL